MRLRELKQAACEAVGENYTADSALSKAPMTRYANWTVREVLNSIRRDTHGEDFLVAPTDFEIDTATEGTAGEYALPADFDEVCGRIRFETTSGIVQQLESLPPQDFFTVQAKQSPRAIATVIGRKPDRMIRFYPTPLNDGVVISVPYKRTEPLLVDDEDELQLFPDNDGWEQIFVMGMVYYASLYSKVTPTVDARAEFYRLLAEKLASMNADSQPSVVDAHLGDVEIEMAEASRFRGGRRRYLL